MSFLGKIEKNHHRSTSEVPVDNNIEEKLEKIASFHDLLEKEKMTVLIVGSGGREYAIASKLIEQDCDGVLDIYYTGPSENAGLNELCVDKYISPKLCNNSAIFECVKKWKIHLVIIGPEQPLLSGLADELHDAGILCFGPRCQSALIETSKSFARKLMDENNMSEYSPRFLVVAPEDSEIKVCKSAYDSQYDCQYDSQYVPYYTSFINQLNGNFVIKPDGPQGGKGVKVSGDHFQTILEGLDYIKEILNNGQTVIIEEKLIGEEFSFMTFTDGITVKHTIPIKDYKRAYDNDKGPNTGSMGSVTGPNNMLWFLTEDDISLAKQINEMIILYLEETTHEPYQGVLYGSFIKTSQGIKVIEYNARFGDPECINLLELMKTNLYDVLLSVATQSLSNLDELQFKTDASVFKYLVPTGYPDKPVRNEVFMFNPHHFEDDNVKIIYGNCVKQSDACYIELGSRTMGLIATHQDLEKAAICVNYNFSNLVTNTSDQSSDLIYKEIRGPLFYRKDIGLPKDKLNDAPLNNQSMMNQTKDAYAKAGVDIDEGNRVVKEIRSAVESTFTPLVCSQFGDFAGMIQVPTQFYNENQFSDENQVFCDTKHESTNNDPLVLVASTDGVGTKSILVLDTFGPEIGYEMLGNDIVNHCINDVLVKGAKPYFFLDYFGAHSIKAEHVKYFVQGVANACKNVGCALLGGETAEMPAVYQHGHSEVSGTMVGIVKQSQIINGKQLIKAGDVVLGMPSSGPHTNGYTLIRKLVSEINPPKAIREQLCATHKSYLPDFEEITKLNVKIHGLCHLTGGGFAENPKRILPDNLNIQYEPFEYSDIFKYLQSIGNISDPEMQKIFNCGIGMMVFLSEHDANVVQDWRKSTGKLPYSFIGRVQTE